MQSRICQFVFNFENCGDKLEREKLEEAKHLFSRNSKFATQIQSSSGSSPQKSPFKVIVFLVIIVTQRLLQVAMAIKS